MTDTDGLTPVTAPPDPWACAEDNPWNPILPSNTKLNGTGIKHLLNLDPLKDIGKTVLALQMLDSVEYGRVTESRQLVFHVMGCSIVGLGSFGKMGLYIRPGDAAQGFVGTRGGDATER